jgi:uncharacterized peroxidase-related enzyme
VISSDRRQIAAMAHIKLPENVPGIRGPMLFSPETTKPLRDFVEVLLRGPNSMPSAEREMIATYVSSQNDCHYCQHTHGAAAAEHLGGNYELIDQLKRDYASAPVSDKLKALLGIAGKVQQGGKYVTTEDVERARAKGATAFCMFNRYVDGLATWQPHDAEMYREMGKRLASSGYTVPGWEKPVQKAQGQ